MKRGAGTGAATRRGGTVICRCGTIARAVAPPPEAATERLVSEATKEALRLALLNLPTPESRLDVATIAEIRRQVLDEMASEADAEIRMLCEERIDLALNAPITLEPDPAGFPRKDDALPAYVMRMMVGFALWTLAPTYLPWLSARDRLLAALVVALICTASNVLWLTGRRLTDSERHWKQARLRAIGPSVVKLKAIHTGPELDRKLRALYAHYGVEPFGGCLTAIVMFVAFNAAQWGILLGAGQLEGYEVRGPLEALYAVVLVRMVSAALWHAFKRLWPMVVRG